MKLRQIYVAEDMAKKLKCLSAEQGVTLHSLANQAIKNFLEDVQNGKRFS